MSEERVVESRGWNAGGVDYRIDIVERADGLLTLRLLRYYPPAVLDYGPVPGGWGNVYLRAPLCDTIERVRELAEEERRNRSTT